MIKNSIYQVNFTNLFFVFFANRELKNVFLPEYDKQNGFGILETEKGYKVFTDSYVFYAQKKISGSTGACIGLRIHQYHAITQSETFDAAVKKVQVVGIPSMYLCVEGERSPEILMNGALQFFDAIVPQKTNATAVPDDEIEEKHAYLSEQEELIVEKEKYDAQFLAMVSYVSFTDTLQNTQDGVIYKFAIESEAEFKENALVAVSVNDKGKPLVGNVVGSEDGFVFVKFRNDSDAFARLATHGEIVEKSNPEYNLKKNAIQILKKGISNNPYLLDILTRGKVRGYSRRSIYTPHKIKDDDGSEYDNVNPSQKEAIEMALDVEDFLLVQGPPGTGKTTIITEMVKLFAKQGKRILICSKNNLAVDNVLEKCQDLYYDDEKQNKMQCLRLGKEGRVLPSVRKVLPRPLTQTIQNDVKEKSEEARAEFIRQETLISEVYEVALEEIEPMFHILKYLLNEKEIYENAERKMRFNLFSIFLGSARKRRFYEETDEILSIIEQLICDFWQMIWEQRVEITADNIENFCKGFLHIWRQKEEVADVVLDAPKRFGMILRENKDYILNDTLSDVQRQKAIASVRGVVSYKGNALAESIAMPVNAENLNSSLLETAHRELKDSVARIREKCFLFKQILDEWHGELQNDRNTFESSLLKSVKIIGATCIGVNTTEEFRDVEYDVAIVDEAGQITMHDLLVPFVKARKIIMIGDHLQLPPSPENDFCTYLKENELLDFSSMETEEEVKNYETELKEIFSVSLFERFFRDPRFDQHKIMLDTQFRMHPVIAEFISKNFYDGKYKSGVSSEKRTLKIGSFGGPMYFIDTCNSEFRYEDVHEDESIHTNQFEAKICASYLAEILVAIEKDDYEMPKKNLKDADGEYNIGVITAYKAQIELIREEIEKCLTHYYEEEQARDMVSHLAINTLDSFQGRDNQIIFYSFVRSNPNRNIGFLDEVRRLNVMMTRAKSLLVMVGDSRTLTGSTSKTVHDGKPAAEYYKKLVDYCREKDGYIDVTKVVRINEET